MNTYNRNKIRRRIWTVIAKLQSLQELAVDCRCSLPCSVETLKQELMDRYNELQQQQKGVGE